MDRTVTCSHDASMRGVTTGLKHPSGKGQGMIVTHIGSDDGFVERCLNVFCGNKNRDYNEETDRIQFEGLFATVLSTFRKGGSISMDTLSYSRRDEAGPTTASKKAIQNRLTSKALS